MRRLDKKGQSVLEYVLVWTAIVGAVIAAVGIIRTKMSQGLGVNVEEGSLTKKIETGYDEFDSGLIDTSKIK